LIALRMSARKTSALSRRRSARIRQTSGTATMATSKTIGNTVVNMVHRLRHCDARMALRDS
jgi:hypothetical protein